MRNTAKSSIRMAWASLGGLAVLLGLTQVAVAEVRYHLVLLPDDPPGQITNTGVILSYNDALVETTLLDPARDAQGNPVWDSDGDGVADGYTIRSLTMGDYSRAWAFRVNEELGIAVGDADMVGEPYNYEPGEPVLWTNIWTENGDGTFGTLIDLGRSHGLQNGFATDVNSRGQVVVRQLGYVGSDLYLNLALVNPKDTDGDSLPDLWFEDLDEDGNNDLMIDLEGISQSGCIGYCQRCLSLNDLGQVVGESNRLVGRPFVVIPEDTDGDGQPDVWFRDSDGDGVNDLQFRLWGSASDISDGGRIVGASSVGNKDYLTQWQIVPPDQINVVVQEWARKGGGFRAINENLQVVGILNDIHSIPRVILWENGQILDLVELLDNPENAENLSPWSINDSGTISGYCGGGGFLAVPIAPSPPEPGITVEPVEGLVTTEAGVADTFSLVLDTQPTAPVTVGLSSNDPSEGTVSPESVTFDTDNWAIAQTVTVTGVDDADADGDVAYTIVTAPAVSDDPDYAGLDADDVAVTNCDDEALPGPSVDAISPDMMYAGTSIPVTIGGSGFASGAEVTFENGAGVAPTANVTSVSSTTIEAVVTAHRNAKAAVWDVRVTNPDGSFDVLVGGFTVLR